MSSLDQISELKKWKNKKRKGPVNKEYTEENLKKGIKINAGNIKSGINNAIKNKGVKSNKALNGDLAWQSIAKKKVGTKKKSSSIKSKLPTTYKKKIKKK